jgi:hypothetical protein
MVGDNAIIGNDAMKIDAQVVVEDLQVTGEKSMPTSKSPL